MSLWNKTTTPPKSLQRGEKRNVVLTSIGWVRKLVTGSRTRSEILVAMDDIGASAPVITDVWTDKKTYSLAGSPVASIWVSFNQPITSATTLTLSVANTVGGAAGTATANTTVYGTNKLNFKWTPATAGTYKIQAQTLAGNNASVKSTNTGTTASLRVISASVSNTNGTFKVTA